MTRAELIEGLSEMEGRFKSFTASDKSFLREVAKEEGMPINEHCPDCWRDIFLVLKSKYMTKKKTKGNSYEFLGHRTMRWRGHDIDGDTPDDVVRAFIADHPNNRNFFRKKTKDNGKKND